MILFYFYLKEDDFILEWNGWLVAVKYEGCFLPRLSLPAHKLPVFE
jgi:hypothetical protein